jgi:ABC-2 type transport system permease protein
VQTLADFLPFKWTFGFPIESLVGDMSTRSLLLGLGAQALWIAGTFSLFRFAFRYAVRHFSAVGG